MPEARLTSLALALAGACLAPVAWAQPACEGGAYVSPQLFRGEAAHQTAVAELEMNAFIARTGLPTAPLYSIKRVDDLTASSRTPYCWTYANAWIGFLSGYRLVVVNNEVVQPAVLAITNVVSGGNPEGRAVPLKSLPAAEQKAVLDQLTRSKCFGTVAGVESAIVKTEGLCGMVEDVAAQVAVGQQGLIAKAAFAWEEQAWAGIATRESAALGASIKGLAGRSEKVHSARLVVVPTRTTSVGFGLYVHPSVPEATIRKAAAAFQALTAPSRPLAIALDLGPNFAFVTPTAEQVDKMRMTLGLGK